jgi:hypothetical protein
MSIMNPSVNGLTTLPEELVLGILDHIDSDDFETILALNTTCRLLHRLTLVLLYRRFPGRAPQQCLRTITLPPPDGNPALASHFKEVVWYQSYWTHNARRRGLSLSDRHVVADKLRNSECILNTTDLSMDLPGRFISFSNEYEVHWWYLEFFLFFTPKVEKLLVYDVWQWDDHSYWFENLASNPSLFENLKSVMLHGPLRLQNIVPLLTLPSIRNLELTQVITMRQEPGRTLQWIDGRDDFVERRLAYGSSLERLILRESDIHFPSATELFKSLRKLKNLTYEHVPNDLTYPTGWLSFVLPSLGEIYHGQDYSLERLRLRDRSIMSEDPEHVCNLFGHYVDSTISIEPSFEKLRVLDIGSCTLASFDYIDIDTTTLFKIVERFPRTLEILHIQWAYTLDWQDELPLFLDFLLSLAQAAAASSDLQLRQVALVDWPALAGWFPLPDELLRLQRVYEEMGMCFTVLYEEIKGQEPLGLLDDVEPEWSWVHKTQSFDTHFEFYASRAYDYLRGNRSSDLSGQ